MKFKKCDEQTQLKLRKASVKRMHRPEKQDKLLRGMTKLSNFYAQYGIRIA
jgi:hypothetical protein